jgi:hypothetical protein
VDHDQRFKVLLRAFLPDFFRLFFPAWADRFDFANAEWLDKEVFPDPPRGERRTLDLVVRLPLRQPPRPEDAGASIWLALVHVEIEAEDRVAPLRQRMFEYSQSLRWQHGSPVLSIGLYLRVGLEGLGWDLYEEYFWGERIIQFRYPYIGLPALNGQTYVAGDNPLGIALTGLMGLPPEKRLDIGRDAWRRLVQWQLNDYQRYLLYECLDAYLPQDDAQRQEFEGQLLTTSDPGEKAMTATLFDKIRQEGWQKGWQEGKQEGRQEGKEEALRESLRTVLEARFGPLPQAVLERVAVLPPEQLDQLLRKATTVESIQGLGLGNP